MDLRTYKYDPKRYFVAVIIPDILILCIFLWSFISLIKGDGSLFNSFLLFLTLFSLIKNYVSLSQPNKIIKDGNKLYFLAYGRQHVYDIGELDFIRIKEIQPKKNIFLRIGSSGLFKGKYWIKIKSFDNGEEIYRQLKELELKIHPGLLQHRSLNKKN
jgi:hypothetical protein